MKNLSIIIPSFNEEAKIANDLRQTAAYLSQQSFTSEIIVVDDGSRDKTHAVATGLAQELTSPKVSLKILRYAENRGKGFAIKYGVREAQGEIIGFMDSGLCVPLKYILDGMQLIQKGADCALASRRLANSQTLVKQPFYRRAGSLVFWKMMRLFMGVGVSDTQCGFKFYSHQAAVVVFSKIKTEGFMFDIEALVLCHQMGFKTVEFPVEWANDADTRFHPVWGTFRNMKELVKIKVRGLQVKKT